MLSLSGCPRRTPPNSSSMFEINALLTSLLLICPPSTLASCNSLKVLSAISPALSITFKKFVMLSVSIALGASTKFPCAPTEVTPAALSLFPRAVIELCLSAAPDAPNSKGFTVLSKATSPSKILAALAAFSKATAASAFALFNLSPDSDSILTNLFNSELLCLNNALS